MPTVAIAPQGWHQYIDANGIPFVGGKLYVYQAGSVVLAIIYADATGTLSPNPIILDAYGQCAFYIDPTKAYKYALLDRFDQTIRTQDNIFVGPSTGILPLSAVFTAADFAAPLANQVQAFIERPGTVQAEQFHVEQKPWPSVVCLCAETPQFARKPHLHISQGFAVDAFVQQQIPIGDGDWIIYRDGMAVNVLSDYAFRLRYARPEVA